MTITGGYHNLGGGIENLGSLTLRDSIVTGNTAASGLFRYGGGIYSDGSLTVVDSVISGNTAAKGGGIYAYGTYGTTIQDSVVADNVSYFLGGGICGSGWTIQGCTRAAAEPLLQLLESRRLIRPRPERGN